jgi:hypothetical protein
MKNLITATLACLIFASCAPSTPQTRIQENPGKFAALSSKDKQAVQQGNIAPGMSPDAVYLAWGTPAESFQGSSKDKITERWDYAATRPVYSTSFYGSYGSIYGGRYGNLNRHAYALGPEIAYVPYRVASVWFLNQRVDSWERVSGENAVAEPFGW